MNRQHRIRILANGAVSVDWPGYDGWVISYNPVTNKFCTGYEETNFISRARHRINNLLIRCSLKMGGE